MLNNIHKILIVATGPWQFVMAYASLLARAGSFSADTALLAPRVSGEMRALASQVCLGLFGSQPRQLHEIFEKDNTNLDYEEIKKKFSSLYDFSEYEEVWISSVLNWRESLVVLSAAGSNVVLYEDGLQSVAKFSAGNESSSSSGAELFNKAKNIWLKVNRLNGFRKPGNLLAMQRDRRLVAGKVSEIYSFNSSPGDAKSKVVSQEHLCATLQKARDYLVASQYIQAEDVPKDKPRMAIVIGQCFARFGMLSEEKECALYLDVIKRVSALGYTPVWKDHPRTGGKYFELLQSGLSSPLLKMKNPGVIPIELLLPEFPGETIVVGIISSSLTYISNIYKMPCFTAVKEFVPYLDETHLKIARHIQQNFPDFSEIQSA